MAEHKMKSDNKTTLVEYVTVAIVEDMEFAEEFRDVLDKSDIPAVLSTQRDGKSEIIGVAIMVPPQLSERAMTIIESQQALDDFLDITFNNEDEDDDYFDDFETGDFEEEDNF